MKLCNINHKARVVFLEVRYLGNNLCLQLHIHSSSDCQIYILHTVISLDWVMLMFAKNTRCSPARAIHIVKQSRAKCVYHFQFLAFTSLRSWNDQTGDIFQHDPHSPHFISIPITCCATRGGNIKPMIPTKGLASSKYDKCLHDAIQTVSFQW